jgi:flagellar hook-basal body complex protein FliE
VETLRLFIEEVNSLQAEAADYTERLLKGEPVELHDVMIAAEKARTSFQLLLELRNKALDLYREVLRMQL